MTEIDSSGEELPNPNLSEQDRGIIAAFSRSPHNVLTTSEISDEVSIENRQVRRRLDNLEEEGVIGQRKASGVRLAWLEEDVKEPITVQYPLLRYVYEHSSVQLFLLGIAVGIVAVLILLTVSITIGYGLVPDFTTAEDLLLSGVIAAVFSALFIVVAIGMALVEWGVKRYTGE